MNLRYFMLLNIFFLIICNYLDEIKCSDNNMSDVTRCRFTKVPREDRVFMYVFMYKRSEERLIYFIIHCEKYEKNCL